MNRSTAALVLAIGLLVMTAFFLLGTIGFAIGTGSSPPDPGLATFGATCTALLAVPGFVFLVLYRQWHSRERKMTVLEALLRPGRDVRIADVAQALGLDPLATIVLVNEAIASGRVSGYIDHGAGTFVGRPWIPAPAADVMRAPTVPHMPEAPLVPRFCRECGNPLAPVPGETFLRCARCGHIETL